MPSTYKINRKGTFSPAFCTANQCAFPGVKEYMYKIAVHFPGDSKLDHRQFLVDHNEIDRVINELRPTGSCEQMEKSICDATIAHLEGMGLDPLKVTLEIGNEEGSDIGWNAWMEYTCDRTDEPRINMRGGLPGGLQGKHFP